MDLTPYINGGLGVASFVVLFWLVRTLVTGQIRADIGELKGHALKSDGRLQKLEEQGEEIKTELTAQGTYVRERLAHDIGAGVAEALARQPIRVYATTPPHGIPRPTDPGISDAAE